jgi:hypothetical protein
MLCPASGQRRGPAACCPTVKQVTPLLANRRALVLEVDTHRAQVSIVLAVANILMMFLNKALALEQLHHDSALLNLNTMKKQVRY